MSGVTLRTVRRLDYLALDTEGVFTDKDSSYIVNIMSQEGSPREGGNGVHVDEEQRDSPSGNTSALEISMADLEAQIAEAEAKQKALKEQQQIQARMVRLRELQASNSALEQKLLAAQSPAGGKSSPIKTTKEKPLVDIQGAASVTSPHQLFNSSTPLEPTKVTLNELREVKDLNSQVHDQLGALGLGEPEEEYEPTVKNLKKGKIKSGMDEIFADQVVRKQIWPQAQLREGHGRGVKFQDLNLRQFTLGELETLSRPDVSEKECQGRLALLKQILGFAAHYKWQALLEFYAEVVQSIETGHKDWASCFTDIAMLSLTMRPTSSLQYTPTKRDDSVGKAKSRAGSSTPVPQEEVYNGTFYCGDFNAGKCQYDQPHIVHYKGKARVAQHICGACWRASKTHSTSHHEGQPSCPNKNLK